MLAEAMSPVLESTILSAQPNCEGTADERIKKCKNENEVALSVERKALGVESAARANSQDGLV